MCECLDFNQYRFPRRRRFPTGPRCHREGPVDRKGRNRGRSRGQGPALGTFLLHRGRRPYMTDTVEKVLVIFGEQ